MTSPPPARRFELPIVGRADRAAERNRARLDLNDVFAVNIVAPRGAGKAALVNRAVGALRLPVLRVALGGEPEGRAGRLGLHLERAALREVDLLLIENDGGQVCPASFKMGAHLDVRVTTVFDEHHGPSADLRVYHGLDALVVTRQDQAREAGFDRPRFLQGLARSHPNLLVFFTSGFDGSGVLSWAEWLLRRRDAHRHATGRRSSVRAGAPALRAVGA